MKCIQPPRTPTTKTKTPRQAPRSILPRRSARTASIAGTARLRGLRARFENWVIAGKHTASGKPLLSNDMHLGLTEPNIWFMADLKAPGFHAAGVTLPGLPFVVAGHNEHVAWGLRRSMPMCRTSIWKSLMARATTGQRCDLEAARRGPRSDQGARCQGRVA